MTNDIHVLLAGDEGVAPGFFVTAGSLIVSCSKGRKVILHVMDTGLNPDTVKRLAAFVGHFKSAELDLFKVDLSPFKQGNAYRGNYATYARLLVGQHLSVDRVLYCDTDFLFLKDAAELFDMDMCGRPICAPRTPMYKTLADDCPFLPAEEAKNYSYFNAGILLIDLSYWRQKNVFDQVLTCLSADVTLEKHDKTILNWIFMGNWTRLDDSWGLLLNHDTDTPLNTNFHFGGGGVKPWQKGCHYSAVPLWWTVYDTIVRPRYRFAGDDGIRRGSFGMLWGAHVLARYPFALKCLFDADKVRRMMERDRYWYIVKNACEELLQRLA